MMRKVLTNPEYDCWDHVGDICYIQSIVLEEEYRGHGIGLLALDGMITMVADNFDVVVLQPTGLTRHKREGIDGPTTERKLTDYYALLGFRVFAENNEERRHATLMGLDMQHRRPRIDKIVPHLFEDGA